MKITEFKVDQTVYVMGDGQGQKNRFQTHEGKVIKIGRKYVTISGAWGDQFKETPESRPYLIEHTEVGMHRLLFPSSEAVHDYVEREELKTWVREAAGWSKIDRYSLDQLRAVKKILEAGA